MWLICYQTASIFVQRYLSAVIFLICGASPYRIDLAVLLGKTPPSTSEPELAPLEASQPPSLSQALVFSNSKQGGTVSQPPTSAPYGQHSMVSFPSLHTSTPSK